MLNFNASAVVEAQTTECLTQDGNVAVFNLLNKDTPVESVLLATVKLATRPTSGLVFPRNVREI